jgi:hypothetical protein
MTEKRPLKLHTLNRIFRFFGFMLVVAMDVSNSENPGPTQFYFMTKARWDRITTNPFGVR